MTRSTIVHNFLLAVIAGGAIAASASRAEAAAYTQTDLVSDLSGLAKITDPSLINPWGLSHSSTSPFWISDQGTNLTNLWMVTGPTTVMKVTGVNPPTGNITIPPGGVGAVGPTGQVNNGNTASFLIPVTDGGDGNSAHFIFANLNGTISAWDMGATSHIVATTPGAVYTGLAINQTQTMLYAANDAGAGSVDVFNSTFGRVTTPGAFATPSAVAALNLVPFNVRDIGGKVYVEYAPSGRANQQNAALGQGAVVVFDENGNFIQTLALGSRLAAPWGIALAPTIDWGPFTGDLLVGNFSYLNSEIDAYDPITGAFEGTIPIDPGAGQTAGGLWALDFGIGGSNGDPFTLYVTDGIDGETHGLFAAISAVPEPTSLALLAAALGLVAVRRTRSRRLS